MVVLTLISPYMFVLSVVRSSYGIGKSVGHGVFPDIAVGHAPKLPSVGLCSTILVLVRSKGVVVFVQGVARRPFALLCSS